MEFGLKDLFYIIGIVVSAVISFLGTRHRLKEYIRDKNDLLKDEINSLKLKLQEQKSRDDLQQQVIDQIGKQMDELIPKLVEEVKHKKEKK
ncbi:hypothetical protein [Luteirhabdus pelagi]|uniref:hypothetical protein n=1 Tax=Luteirhabdus pelagi TaxID=2792783 RepID=UPI001939A83C|nr:hypothetical protein [Luteirhabdus pelagi]